MRFSIIEETLLAALVVQLGHAHTTFTNFFIDDVPQGDGTCVRMSNIIHQATFPIQSITGDDMACGVNGQTGVDRVCGAKAGWKLTFEYRVWPDDSGRGSIDPSHKGPCAVYMKKVDSAIQDNAVGDGWFNIYKDHYDATLGKWCTEKLIPNDGHLSVTIPEDLAGGYYLVRPELLALHQADKTPADPQFYVGCAQIFLNSSGSASPTDTVSIPGYVDMNTPAMTFNIWDVPMKLPFPDFGPKTYSSSSKRDLNARNQLVQTEGLEPPNCLITNDNWCGVALAKYSDEGGCWSASQNCFNQLSQCYNSAGPTGSKHCRNWESYCDNVQNACKAGNYAGPPSCQSYIPPKPALLSDSSTPASPAAMDGNTPAAASYAATMPVSNTPQQLNPSANENGSTDTCGANGGLTCKTGLCCSSHGYCGTSQDYCGAGCQPAFGTCSPASKLRREHKRRGLHHQH